VEDVPPSTRDSGLFEGLLQIEPGHDGVAEYLITNYTTSPRYAPPAQPFGLNSTTRFRRCTTRYVVPFLTANNLSIINPGPGPNTGLPFSVTMGYRAVSAGGRTDDYVTEAEHFLDGCRRHAVRLRLQAGLYASHNKLSDNLSGGYLSFNQLSALIAAGTYDRCWARVQPR